MISMQRGLAACLTAAAMAAVGTPESAWAQATPPSPTDGRSQAEGAVEGGQTPGDEPPPLPALPVVGWRLGASLYGGRDSNALDIPDGASDRNVELGVAAGMGKQERFSVFGLAAEGSRRQYAEFSGRDAWRAAAGMTAGRRFSRNSIVSLAAGYRYDMTDGFLSLPGVATQLPSSIAQGAFGEGRFAVKTAKRVTWSNRVRYEGLEFDDPGLIDTRATRVRTELDRRMSRRDQLGPGYEFLRTEWGPDSSDTHSFFVDWTRVMPDRWSFNLESGMSRVVEPVATGQDARWLFTGTADLTVRKSRTSMILNLSQAVTPGYGQGRILYGTVLQASATLSLTQRLQFRMAGAVDRSIDPFDSAYEQQGGYVDATLAARIAGRLGIAASYRYRARDSLGEPRVVGNRIGLSLTTAIESSRQPERGGQGPW